MDMTSNGNDALGSSMRSIDSYDEFRKKIGGNNDPERLATKLENILR